MVKVMNVLEEADVNTVHNARYRKGLAKVGDLQIALNVYQPGARNEFHYHAGTSQSFMCVQGKLTVRTKADAEADPEAYYLKAGDCVLIPAEQYYQLHNESEEPAVLYQVKPPGDEIVVEGLGKLNNREYFTKDREGQLAL